MRLPFLRTFQRPCGVGALQYVSLVKAWKHAFLFVSFGDGGDNDDDCGGGDEDDDGDGGGDGVTCAVLVTSGERSSGGGGEEEPSSRSDLGHSLRSTLHKESGAANHVMISCS